MGASEIGMEELLPQKRFHKNCIGTSETNYWIGTTKKFSEELKKHFT